MSTYEAVITLHVAEPMQDSVDSGMTSVTYVSLPIRFESTTDHLASNAAAALSFLQAPPAAPMFAVGHHWMQTDADTIEIIPTGGVISYDIDITALPDEPVPAE